MFIQGMLPEMKFQILPVLHAKPPLLPGVDTESHQTALLKGNAVNADQRLEESGIEEETNKTNKRNK